MLALRPLKKLYSLFLYKYPTDLLKKKNNFWTRGVKNEEEFEIWRLFKLSKIASSQKLDLPSFHSPPYPAKKKNKKNSYLYLRKSGPWRLVLLLWKDKPQDGFHIISL